MYNWVDAYIKVDVDGPANTEDHVVCFLFFDKKEAEEFLKTMEEAKKKPTKQIPKTGILADLHDGKRQD